MSKAFTKDDAASDDVVVPARRPLPDGATNYVTPRGLEALRSELQRLHDDRAGLDASSAEVDRTRALHVAARALLGKRVGEAVTLRTPRGEEELEIVEIA